MKSRPETDRRCAYLVIHEDDAASADDLQKLAAYLSTVGVAGCDVVVVDDTPSFARNGRIFRWVGRHVAALPRHRGLTGSVDALRAALDLARGEKIIVARARVRYDAATLVQMCALLDTHEVVEPQDYCERPSWWSSIDAGRILVHRGIEPMPDHGATFGFRRSAVRSLRGLDLIDSFGHDSVRRLQALGATVHCASELFVRCEAQPVGEWIRERARQADADFALPVKSAFFFALMPMAALLLAFGGARLAAAGAATLAAASVVLALRGRAGAATFFPLRACLFAPLWLLERSLSVYWALLRKISGTNVEHRGLPVVVRERKDRVASGE